jgi:ubiquinone/menaquinone biosynthesis C-methylase UbiE
MSDVAQLYDQDPEREWRRLVFDAYRSLEFLVTMHYIRRHFPDTGRVLDAGGGPGRYSVELCRSGYDVVLLDPSPRLIDFAREKFEPEPPDVRRRLTASVVGDVRDLSTFNSDSFDAALCLDPLSYLPDPSDQTRAIHELIRVCKQGATVCLSARGYLAVLRTLLARFRDQLIDPEIELLVSHGNNVCGGVLCHFYRAEELRELAESCGLHTLDMAGCEGLSAGLPEATNFVAQEKAAWQRWVKLLLETSSEPAVVDMAEHILYVGQVAKQ